VRLEDFILRLIYDHERIKRDDILARCESSQNVIDVILTRLRAKKLIESSTKRPVHYFLTEKGKKYCRDKIRNTQKIISLSEKEIFDQKDEILKSFKREIRNQIILPDDLVDLLVTIPFCRGSYGRNKLGISTYFMGDCGRGKDMLHEVYRDLMDSEKVDCRGFFTDGKEKLKELKNIVGSYPDILFVDEIGILHGNPRLAYQSYLDNKDFPVIFLGNPETTMEEIKNASSFEHIVEKSMKSGKAILDRIHLWVYWPPLTLQEKTELPKIIFNTKHENLGAIASYIQYAFENCDPVWTTEAQEYFSTILDNAEDLLSGKRKYRGKYQKPDHYIVRAKQGSATKLEDKEKWINLNYHIKGARFTISIMSLSRALAMQDLRDEILGKDVLGAIEIKFNFLKKLYGSERLIRDLTSGIEKKKVLEVRI